MLKIWLIIAFNFHVSILWYVILMTSHSASCSVIYTVILFDGDLNYRQTEETEDGAKLVDCWTPVGKSHLKIVVCVLGRKVLKAGGEFFTAFQDKMRGVAHGFWIKGAVNELWCLRVGLWNFSQHLGVFMLEVLYRLRRWYQHLTAIGF